MRRLIACLTTLACLCGLAAFAAPVSATVGPTISLTSAPTRIADNHTWVFGYSASGVHSGSHIALQFADGGNWEPISVSGPVHGTVKGHIDTQGPNQPGKFRTRVAVVRSGKTVVASAAHTVLSFGTVSFTALCHGVFHVGGTCEKGAADSGSGKPFHYVIDTTIDGEGNHQTLIGAPATSCKAITFVYDGDTGDENVFVLRQPGASTLTRTTRDDRVQRVHATLTGGKFSVTVTNDDNDLFLYWNGTATCYTANGKP